MRDSVVIDGVTLTRAQVEKAQRELNKPEGWKPGEVAYCPLTGMAYLVTEREARHDFQVNVVTEFGYETQIERVPTCDKRIGRFDEIVKFYREAKGL